MSIALLNSHAVPESSPEANMLTLKCARTTPNWMTSGLAWLGKKPAKKLSYIKEDPEGRG